MPDQPETRLDSGSYSPLFNRALKRWDTPPTSPTFERRSSGRLCRRSSGASQRTSRTTPPSSSASSHVPEPQSSPLQRFFSILRKPATGAVASPSLDKDLPALPLESGGRLPYPSAATFRLGPPPADRRTGPRYSSPERASIDIPHAYSDHNYATASQTVASKSSSGRSRDAKPRYHFVTDPSTHPSEGSGCPSSTTSKDPGRAVLWPVGPSNPPSHLLPDIPYTHMSAAERSLPSRSASGVSAYSRIRRPPSSAFSLAADVRTSSEQDRGPPLAPENSSLLSCSETLMRPSDFLDLDLNIEESLNINAVTKAVNGLSARWMESERQRSPFAPTEIHSPCRTFTKDRFSSSSSVRPEPHSGRRAGQDSFLAFDEYDV